MATPVQTPCVLSTVPSATAAIAKTQGLLEAAAMKRLLRRLSRVAAAAGSYQPLRPDSGTAPKLSASSSISGARRLGCGARVPEGHVPVCVGEEGGPVERYAVRTDILGQPAFAALLRRAAQEYGYGHPGALRIPCPVADFRRLLLRISTAGDHSDDDDNGGVVY